MARLNVSIPDDLHDLAAKWRGSINLSEICARALREELEAAEARRTSARILDVIRPQSALEREVADKFGLLQAHVQPQPRDHGDSYTTLGEFAARVVDGQLHDDQEVLVAGGRQMWSVVRNMSQRSLRVRLSALGLASHDSQLLHAHSNTLITLLWLLYSPRAQARHTGWPVTELEEPVTVSSESSSTVLLASCAPFDPHAPIAKLLSKEAVSILSAADVIGDFAYQFLTADGEAVDYPQPPNSSVLDAARLRHLSRSSNNTIMLIAAGTPKIPMMRLTISASLCNSLITDEASARTLLEV